MSDDRRKPWWRDGRWAVSTLLTCLMAFGGSYIGLSRRVAVLESKFNILDLSIQKKLDELSKSVGEVRAMAPTLSKVQSDTEHNTRDITLIQSDMKDLNKLVGTWSGKIANVEAEQKRSRKP